MYLQNLPETLSEYGLNKTIVTRALSIDWKHRDSEMHLRNPLLLDKVSLDFDIKQLYQNRSNQLRYIYRVNRSIFKNTDINRLIYLFDFIKEVDFNVNSLGNVYIDISLILNGIITNKQLISNATVFSYNLMKQQDMIKFFIAKDLPIPKQFISTVSFNELDGLFKNNISFILLNEHTFKESELLYLWLSNYHLYFTYLNENNTNSYSRVSFKTDTNLPIPISY